MTDEEKKAIEFIKSELEDEKKARDDYQSLTGLYGNLEIEILLNLIEKQSKEIEELKEERKKYPIAMNDEQYKKVIELAQKDIKEELDRQINARIVNEEFIENNFISKDKIKAKIVECRKILYSFEKELQLKANKDKFIHKESMNCLLGQISILQSLLRKEFPVTITKEELEKRWKV